MGHSSNRPVVVNGTLMDLSAFKPLSQTVGVKGSLNTISADGTVIGEWYPDSYGGKSSLCTVGFT